MSHALAAKALGAVRPSWQLRRQRAAATASKVTQKTRASLGRGSNVQIDLPRGSQIDPSVYVQPQPPQPQQPPPPPGECTSSLESIVEIDTAIYVAPPPPSSTNLVQRSF